MALGKFIIKFDNFFSMFVRGKTRISSKYEHFDYITEHIFDLILSYVVYLTQSPFSSLLYSEQLLSALHC